MSPARGRVQRRREVAATAARLLADGFAEDFEQASERAMRELGGGRGDRPDARELRIALAEYLALFEGERHRERITALRTAAAQAMRTFERFEARLVGPVWYGTACADTPVTLHLFSDETEAVSRFLIENRIHFDLVERPCRFRRGAKPVPMPTFVTERAGLEYELCVFPRGGAYHRPLSAIDFRPVKRIDAAALTALIDSRSMFADELASIG